MGKLFGTDGIRGKANQYPMTADMAVRTGRAVAAFFAKNRSPAEIVIGMDTRISGPMIAHALTAGICSMGVDVLWVGILPTPAVAVLVGLNRAAAGIVISASHNPYEDNGIKIFAENGHKLSDKTENEIENLILNENNPKLCKGIKKLGRVVELYDAGRHYTDFLKKSMPEGFSLEDMNIVLDCANGATYKVAPLIFQELGASAEELFVSPDGININDQCGSQYTQFLSAQVIKSGAHIGLAFDGDGDRLIAVDEKGGVVTGDQILCVCGKFMKSRQTLKNNRIVSTVMSNLGMRTALMQMGVDHIMAKVGDRYVMEEMRASGALLGGEDSGHLIFLDHHITGDGIMAALKLLEVLKSESAPISELAGIMQRFPQKLVNVEVSSKPDLKGVFEIQKVISDVENELQETGRVLVRYSGTQPMCRVMVEAKTVEETETYCRRISEVISRVLG
jgi:phosphoglucosamine mutase